MDQPEAQVYEDCHNLSKGTKKTRNYQAVDLRPMQKRSSKPLSELSRGPSQKGGNSDKPPPDLNKPLPDLPPEAFKPPSAATSAKTKESLTHQAEQTSDNALGNRAPRQPIQDKSQYRQTEAQSGDKPAQSLQQLREKGSEEEGAMKSRDDIRMALRDGKNRQRVRWLDEQ